MKRRHKSKFDYYHELGVEETASVGQIKSAYRVLAKRYHPDKNNGNKEDEARFKRVSEAYEVLNDPAMRKLYDSYEHPAVRIAPEPGGKNTDGTEKKTPQRSPFVDFIRNSDNVVGTVGANGKVIFRDKKSKKNPFTKYQK